MKNAFLFALAVLAAGCAGDSQPEVVTVQHQSRQAEVVTRPAPQPQPQQEIQAAPSLRIIGEEQAVTRPPAQVRVQFQPQPQPQPRPQPSTIRQTAQQQEPKTEVYFLQVGPPVVLNTAPTITATPNYPTYQSAPAPTQAPPPASPSPSPTTELLETAPGFTYQNGGVMGSTAPPTSSPSPALPTAEGFQYQNQP